MENENNNIIKTDIDKYKDLCSKIKVDLEDAKDSTKLTTKDSLLPDYKIECLVNVVSKLGKPYFYKDFNNRIISKLGYTCYSKEIGTLDDLVQSKCKSGCCKFIDHELYNRIISVSIFYNGINNIKKKYTKICYARNYIASLKDVDLITNILWLIKDGLLDASELDAKYIRDIELVERMLMTNSILENLGSRC